MISSVPLSVLDLAVVPSGSSSARALQDCVTLAGQVEQLGYTRFWVAEHHGMPGVASSAPAVLMAAVAAATSRIRVGSGGVMLPNHSPMVVAEQFGMLQALYPGRIDLGLGRAPGTDQRTARALRRTPDLSAEDFPQDLQQLRSFFAGTEPGLTAIPAEGNAPELYLLGSSGFSAQLAGLLGLPFAFAHHFSGENTLAALALYRSSFRPSTVLSQPYALVCSSVIVADTTAQARRLALSGALSFVRLRTGRPGVFPSVAEAEAYPWTPQEWQWAQDRIDGQVVGDPTLAEAQLDALIAATGADEIMVTTMTHDPAARLRSFSLLAGLAGLNDAASVR